MFGWIFDIVGDFWDELCKDTSSSGNSQGSSSGTIDSCKPPDLNTPMGKNSIGAGTIGGGSIGSGTIGCGGQRI